MLFKSVTMPPPGLFRCQPMQVYGSVFVKSEAKQKVTKKKWKRKKKIIGHIA